MRSQDAYTANVIDVNAAASAQFRDGQRRGDHD
jgi:hypothetical protein